MLRRYGPQFLQARGSSLTGAERDVLEDLTRCRTAALGGHVAQCDHCGHRQPVYNSCRNRHCPKCQAAARAGWLDDRERDLLPVGYFHLVFTLPPGIAQMALQNKEIVYSLLFHCSAETLQEVAAETKYLGAEIGFLSVLHTWGQNLMHHPHVHCIVAGGGLSADQSRWISSRQNFFLPVRVLSRVFRGKFLERLQAAFDQGKLGFHGSLAAWKDADVFKQRISEAYGVEWVVYAQAPIGGPSPVLKYLARYTHRVAISNNRLLDMEGGLVRFRWKNYTAGGRWQTMTLEATEFIRRFLLHVLPSGFVRIRYYGFLAHRHREVKLRRCRELLSHSVPAVEKPAELPSNTTPREEFPSPQSALRCPVCHVGRLVATPLVLFPSSFRRPRLPPQDTS